MHTAHYDNLSLYDEKLGLGLKSHVCIVKNFHQF